MATDGPEAPSAVPGPSIANELACSNWARTRRLDPIGTAGCYRGYLLVEWPLPWPRDLGEVPALAPVVAAMAGRGLRLQGLVPASVDGLRRVIVYRWPAGGGASYRRAEAAVEPDQVVEAAIALLEDRPVAAGSSAPGMVTDVLVCAHGRRDRCCGSLGTVLAQELAGDEVLRSGGARVWRTSHTGGHRFAPTVIVLPQGTVWGYADADVVRQVVRSSGPVRDLLPRYRGCAGMASPAVQALERAVFAEVGWSLFASLRVGTELGDGVVRLEVDGEGAAWEAAVRVAREVPVPECGSPIEAATKTEPELVVERLVRR